MNMDIYDLLYALGDVSDCFVTETETKSPLVKERAVVRWASLAACACIVLAGAFFPLFYRYIRRTTPGASVTSGTESGEVTVELLSLPDKTEYLLGEELDTSGLSFTVTYGDGTTGTVSSGFSCPVTVLDELGEYEITVSYMGADCIFAVNVAEPEVKKIELSKLPDKLEYYVYEKTDTTGAELTVTYENGYERTVTDGFTYEPRLITSEYADTVTVQYGNARATYIITVELREATDVPLLSGACGDGVYFTLDAAGTLTVTGAGDMSDGSPDAGAPWGEYAEIIRQAVIGDGVTSIGGYAFYGCCNMTYIDLPDGLTEIGDYAFSGCGLESVALPPSLQALGSHAFSECGTLISIKLPDKLTEIGDNAFCFCGRLSEVELGGGLSVIGGSAFASCTRLTSIVIPDSVTEIGGYAFDGCSSLASVSISQNVSVIGEGVFRNCEALAAVILPSGLSAIGEKAFYGCFELQYISIPAGVGEIGGWAFSMCENLRRLTVPESVYSIGPYAFFGCMASARIYIENRDCEIYDSANTLGWMMVYGCAGSTAQEYAEKYGYYFEEYETGSVDEQ